MLRGCCCVGQNRAAPLRNQSVRRLKSQLRPRSSVRLGTTPPIQHRRHAGCHCRPTQKVAPVGADHGPIFSSNKPQQETRTTDQPAITPKSASPQATTKSHKTNFATSPQRLTARPPSVNRSAILHLHSTKQVACHSVHGTSPGKTHQ